MSDKTHFGFEEVNTVDKSKKVGNVFHSVAEEYDLMNDIMSFGMHRLWKRMLLELSGLTENSIVLDIASGTADIPKLIIEKFPSSEIHVTDINESMLRVGRDRIIDKGKSGNISYSLANAEKLPFKENTFDCICIAYGLRNVTDKQAALGSMFAMTKPGGRVLVLEFSKPVNPLIGKAYDIYSTLWPKAGQLITGDGDSYKYLVESIRMHPDQETLKQMMLDAGFENCEYHNVMGGICAIHVGHKAL